MDDWQAILTIVAINLALSGDNALVIGMAARNLPPAQRRSAILVGGAVAVGLRVIATSVVTLLLTLPYLRLVGGLALLVIAFRLSQPGDEAKRGLAPAGSFRAAVGTILAADAVMSLENVLGVGAAAHGDVALLAFGLALSIPIVLLGSDLVARLLDRFPVVVWIGVLALVSTAVDLVLADPAVLGLGVAVPEVGVTAATLLVFVGVRFAWSRRA